MKDKKTLFYKILWLPIVGVSKLFNCKIINKDRITDDRLILAGTHTSIFDCLMLIASTKRPVHFLAKKELFSGFKGILFRNMGLIPVDRSKKDRSSIDSALEYLKKGDIICIFPEGTTQKGRGLLPFKIGAVKIAHDSNTKILPFIIKGKYKPFSRDLKLEFGKAIKIKSDDLDQENERLRNIIIDMLEG